MSTFRAPWITVPHAPPASVFTPHPSIARDRETVVVLPTGLKVERLTATTWSQIYHPWRRGEYREEAHRHVAFTIRRDKGPRSSLVSASELPALLTALAAELSPADRQELARTLAELENPK